MLCRNRTWAKTPRLLRRTPSYCLPLQAFTRKNRHYKRIYAELPDPVVFMPVTVSTSDRINEETLRSLFLHANREASALTGELPEE